MSRDRYPRPASQADVEAVRGRVSDAKKLFASETSSMKDRMKTVEEAVKYLAEARRDDRAQRNWLIGLVAVASIALAGQSFASCIQSRESIAELKAEVRSIKKGQ